MYVVYRKYTSFKYFRLGRAVRIPHTGACRKLKEGVMDGKDRGFRVRDGRFRGWIQDEKDMDSGHTLRPSTQNQGADRGKVERQQVAASEMVLPQLPSFVLLCAKADFAGRFAP